MTFHRGKFFIWATIAVMVAGCGRHLDRHSKPSLASSASASAGDRRSSLFGEVEYVIPDTIGIAFWDKEYTGARAGHQLDDSVTRLARKGFQTYKIPLDPRDARDFFGIVPANATEDSILTDLANSEGYRNALSTPGLRTVVLTVFDGVTTGVNGSLGRFANGTFLKANKDRIVATYYGFALALFHNHKGSGKDFIITGWELDNSMYCGEAYSFAVDSTWNYFYVPSDPAKFITLPSFRQMCLNGYAGDPSRGIPPIANYASKYGAKDPVEAYQNVTLWFQYRQEGIRKAQAQAESEGISGINVRDGIEFNTVHLLHDRINPATNKPFPSALFDVIPVVRPAVPSYSAYESTNAGTLLQDFPIIEQQTAGLEVGLSEYGFGESDAGRFTTTTEQVLDLVNQHRLSFGIAWQAFYWKLSPQMGLLKDDGSDGPLLSALLAALPPQPDPKITDFYASGANANEQRSYATLKGTNFSLDGDNTVTSDCPNLEKVYDGPDGNKVSGVHQINVRVPLRSSAFSCNFTVTKPSGAKSGSVKVDMDFTPTPQPSTTPSPTPTQTPAPAITVAVASGTSASEQKSYATLKGMNFSTNGDNKVMSDCGGLEKVYDGIDGNQPSNLRQINVRVPLRSSAFNCSFQVARPDGSPASNVVTVAMGFLAPPPSAAITQAFPAGYNTAEGRTYAALKGTNFSTNGDNVVTSNCAGLEKVYDGVDGANQLGIRQINVRVPLQMQAFSCSFQVRRPDGSAPSGVVNVNMDFPAPPPPPLAAAVITQASAGGTNTTEQRSYAVLKGMNFSMNGDNIVTSDCGGLEKVYDGIDGAQQPGIRQINVRVPLRTQAFNCSFQVRRPDGSAASNVVTVAMGFIAPPPPPPPQSVPTIAQVSVIGPDPTTGNIYITIYGSGFGSGGAFAVNSSDGNTVRVSCAQGSYLGMFSDTYDGAGIGGGGPQINTTVPASASGNTNCRVTVTYNGATSAPSAPFNL